MTRRRSTRSSVGRVVAGGIALAATALGLSGCIALKDVSISQEDLLGPGRLVVTACISKENGTYCPSGGFSGIFPTPDPAQPLQPLVGFLVAADDQYPATARGMTYSPSYSSELARVRNTPDGTKWVGYIGDPSGDFYTNAGYAGTVSFVRPTRPDGSVDPSVRVSVVVGGRKVTVDLPASRPVVCNANGVFSSDQTVCVDAALTTAQHALHEFTLLAPGSVTAERGTTAVIPVTGVFSGSADPQYTFALTGSTTLPGSSATPNVPTLAPPTDSRSSLSLSVPVPANAAPGTYRATVTATLGQTQESRSATVDLVVPGGAPGTGSGTAAGAPRITVRAPRGVRAARVGSDGFAVRVATDRAVSGRVALTQARTVRRRGKPVRVQVVVAARRVVLNPPSTTVVFRTRALRPGKVVVRVTAAGVTATGGAVLR